MTLRGLHFDFPEADPLRCESQPDEGVLPVAERLHLVGLGACASERPLPVASGGGDSKMVE